MLKNTIIVLVILIASIVLLALRFILVGKNTQQALDLLNKNLRQKKHLTQKNNQAQTKAMTRDNSDNIFLLLTPGR